MILATDVHYTPYGATAAAVAFSDWAAERPERLYVSRSNDVKAYRPGHFYERELPCLLRLLEESGAEPAIVLVDGYVYLDGHSLPGLGKRLFDALGGRVKVVGVAKSAYRGIGEEFAVLRGASRRPLYVTSVGEDLAVAKAGVLTMAGRDRIPLMLRLADQLSRGNVGA